MALDTYLDLCTQVYELSKPAAPQAEYDFFRSYVAAANGPVLEPMCGTGRLLLPLLAEGFDVRGFDASPNMLNVLREKAHAQNLTLKIWEGFLEDLNQSEKYGLIFIAIRSFGLITDMGTAQLALQKIHAHLLPGGVFVFEAFNRAKPTQTGEWQETVWPRPDGTEIKANFMKPPDENNIRTTICKYELIDGNIAVKTETESLHVRLYPSKQLMQMLKAAGFSDIRLVKAFNRSQAPAPDDESIVYECRK